MKPVLMTLLAGAALAAGLSAAVPAAAQVDPRAGYGQDVRHDERGSYGNDRHDDHGGWRDDDWRSRDWSGRGYAGFTDEYRRIDGMIRHGMRDGSLDGRQARIFLEQARNIQNRADIQQRRGRFDPRETQALLDRLLDRIRVAHARGHQHDRRYGDNRYHGGQDNDGRYDGGRYDGGRYDNGRPGDPRYDARYDNRRDDSNYPR